MFDMQGVVRPRAMALAIALVLGLSACGGGGGSNVRPSPPPTNNPTPPADPDFNVNVDDTTVWPGGHDGTGALNKGGKGRLVVTGTNTYTGGTTIDEGTLQIGDGGTTGSIVGDVANKGSLVFNRGDDITFGGIVSGGGSLAQIGKGTLVLTGGSTYTGGTTISNGTLQLGNGGKAGWIVGNVANDGALEFNRSDDITFGGIVSGSGSLAQIGKGKLILTGDSIYTRGTTISNGTLQIGNGGTVGSIVGNVIDNATLAFDRSDDVTFDGTITGAGGLTKAAKGALTLTGTNDYTGVTLINVGSLYVDGDQSAATGATIVADGGLVGGMGILGGDVTVADGATLAPGSSGAIGTLTVKGNLVLSAGSTLDYTFGQSNDLTSVGGDLVLDGTLDASAALGGGFGPGLYRVFNYSGTLTDNGLTLGNVPTSNALVQTGVAQQVNLLVEVPGMTYSFWDGDAGPKDNNAINGGSGTWENETSLTIDNWTDANGATNAPFGDRSFAVFQAAPGTITVDDSNGDVNVAGMQFASDGYVIQGDAIHLAGSADDPVHSVIRVGDGTNAGADYKATINSSLRGDSALVKVGTGTLVLTGINTYTGGTTISDGTLQLGDNGKAGSIIGNVTNNGTLVFDYEDGPNVVRGYAGAISGSGSVVKSGQGALALMGDSTYAGGTTISDGTLQIGDGGNTGSIVGDITNNGILEFDRGDDYLFEGDISGSGSLVKDGSATLVLTGNNTYAGTTTISWGTLQIGNGGTTGSIVGDVIIDSYNGSLVFNRSDDWSYDGTVSGSKGIVKLGNGTLVMGGESTYTGPTAVKAGTLKIVAGGALGLTTISVGGDQDATLEIDKDAAVSGGVSLEEGGKLDNAGNLVTEFVGSSAVTGFSDSVTVMNHDGGLIEGGMALGPNSVVTNSAGSTIRGVVATGGIVNNANSIIDSAADGVDGAVMVNNSDGGRILAGTGGGTHSIIRIGVKTIALNAVVNNVGGSTINGVRGGVRLGDGGTVINDNESVISGNVGVTIASMSGTTGSVSNTGGSTITGAQTGVVLNTVGTVINGLGSVIETTATASTDCSVTIGCSIYATNGALNLSNKGAIIGNVQMDAAAINSVTLVAGSSIQGDLRTGSNVQSVLTLDGGAGTTQLYSSAVEGATTFGGRLVKNGGGLWIIDNNGLQAVTDTSINAGALQSTQQLSGNVGTHASGELDGVPGVMGNLSNAGTVAIHDGDSMVGGDYAQSSTGTLAVSLGSKLDVTGTATLDGGTLRVTGADSGYVANTHTEVLTADAGVDGTFDQLVKDTGVVFTSSTINYDANSVWLDTTGLDVTTAAKGGGVDYTPVSMGSAVRVQGAFEQLDNKIATGSLDSASSDFVQAAGQFQQSPDLYAAQASLESLSGQLHAASAGMVLQAIDAAGRALSERLDDDEGPVDGQRHTWMRQLSQGGDMARNGFADVDYQLDGWLAGTDVRVGQHALAGFAFSQGSGMEQLAGRFDRNRSRNTEGMVYAGWTDDHWYAQGRVGMGQYRQRINRMLLLGTSYQGVWTQYDGRYNVAYGESGLRFDMGSARLTPFVDLEYDRVTRDGFAEQGAGGFGLKSGGQALSRWRGGLGLKLARPWQFAGGRSLGLDARVQWRRTLSADGAAFDASFVGLDEWRPLTGVGLSRRSAVFGLDLDARPSANSRFKLGYEYLAGDRGRGGVASARFSLAF